MRRSDRKAAQLLGVTLTRDHAPCPPKPTLVGTLRKRLGFLGKKHPATNGNTSSSEDLSEDGVVWDVPNPFAPPDPSLAPLRALIQAEIARTARYESIGPLESVHDEDGDDDDSEDEDYDSEDFDSDDDYDGEDADAEDDDYSDDDFSDDDDKPATIVLPRLLPIPLRFIPSMHTLHPHPPPSPAPSSGEELAPWADVAQAYNDIAEADERARKAKRDAHRSRSKALAILGPEASSAL
jgi:hypothetical protein